LSDRLAERALRGLCHRPTLGSVLGFSRVNSSECSKVESASRQRSW
jgi:hypothetical protein